MKVLRVFRQYFPEQTPSDVILMDDDKNILFHFTGIELAWKDNKRRESCIPEGIYLAKKHISPKFGKCLWIQDVPDRSEILVHPANYSRQLLGCMALGMNFSDIDGDGLVDVTESRKAVNKLLSLMGEDNEITIVIQ